MKKYINKKFILLISVIVLAFTFVSIITYAYYKKNFNTSYDINTSITEENVCEVSTFEELYYACVNNVFNDSNKVSENRKIIRLTNNIDLTNNLILNYDAHIDLNSKILNLKDYTFSIIHSYAGSFMLYNGTIKTSSNGRIVINTTNASYLTESVSFIDDSDNAISDSSTYVKVVSINEMYTMYNALYSISTALVDDVSRRPEYLTYEEFNVKNIASFDSTLFLPTFDCNVDSNSHACGYVYNDIVLINHYLSNDINITYTSSDTSVLSNSGNVNGIGTCTLSVSLSIGENNYTCDFLVHIVSSGSLDAAEAMIKSYLSDLYKDESLKISNDITHDNYYFFTTGRDLPLKSNDGNVTYSYKAFSDSTCSTEIKTVSKERNGVYCFEPNEECYYLQITISNNNNESRTVVLNMYTIYVAKYETVAKLILNELYGGSLVYNTANGPTTLESLDAIKEKSDKLNLYVDTYKLTNVTYALKEGTDAYNDYKIESGALDIKVDTTISMKEEAAVVTFEFDEEIVSVELYITYVIGAQDATSSFLPYYTSYDNKISSQASLETFTMPFSYENKGPYTIYDFSDSYVTSVDEGSSTTTYTTLNLSKPDSLKVQLCDKDGNVINDFTSSYTDGTSIANAFDTYLGSSTISSFASNNPGAYWYFSFDTSKILIDDVKTVLIYNYKFNDAGSWTRYQKTDENDKNIKFDTDLTTSLFTINGGLIYSTDTTLENSVRNESLFIYLYNNLNSSADDITSASNNVILNDWFENSIEINATLIPLSGDIDINGIQYLTSCTYLNLSGITITQTKVDDIISKLTNLETLDISSASISDSSILTNLKNMTSLKTLYINGNSIDKFEFLTDITSLSEVYLYENTVTNSSYYGSEGMCNFQTYEDLLRKGISVYYKLNSSGIAMAYENTTDLNDYQRLKSIEYQSILKSGIDISVLYSKFESLTYEDFCLDNFISLTWSYGGGIDATDATYFQVTATNTSGIELVVKYYIDRY